MAYDLKTISDQSLKQLMAVMSTWYIKQTSWVAQVRLELPMRLKGSIIRLNLVLWRGHLIDPFRRIGNSNRTWATQEVCFMYQVGHTAISCLRLWSDMVLRSYAII